MSRADNGNSIKSKNQSRRGGARPGAGRKPKSAAPQTAKPSRVLAIEYVAPSVLKPAPYNPRTMDAEARRRFEHGIAVFGLVDPIIARRSDRLVIGGHQKHVSALHLNLASVPVIYLDNITDDQAAALNVLLNNPAAQGEWDEPKLSELLAQLDGTGLDMTLLGFEDDELARLLGGLEESDDGGDDAGETDQLGGVEYQVVVTCDGERAQAQLCTELEARGLKCRLLTL